MTLQATLEALANNASVSITLVDDNDANLITFGAPGYASIEGDLGSYIVKSIKIVSQKEVTIAIKES